MVGPQEPQCERLKLAPFFDRYERFIYMDDTCIMTPDCPNLFDLVPEGVLGCVVEPFDNRQMWLQKSLDRYGVDRCNGLYFNAEMLVFSQSHRVLFRDIHDLVKRPLWDQDYFNAMVNKYDLPVHDLGTSFNYLGSMIPARLENPAQGEKVYIWHLTTGCPSRLKYGREINKLICTEQI
ncbi:hypothetical protein N9H39_04570 [Gammaproteobacteria bacterium]|nr:hypothetical protein [Gammaproteobacteria bacterium]